MKTLLIAVLVAMFSAGGAFAATQQEKMKSCNVEAKAQALKGDARRAFMSQCLAVTPEEREERLALREKTRNCASEAKAKALRGDERKQFIAQCAAA